MPIPKIIVTTGEPSGIGPDVFLMSQKNNYNAKISVVSDISILQERAEILKLKFNFEEVSSFEEINIDKKETIFCIHVKNDNKVIPGNISENNSRYVLKTLDTAIDFCEKKISDAIVTGPVNKASILSSGHSFYGHTEYIERKVGGNAIMMIHSQQNRIALLTTHIPLSDVRNFINEENLRDAIKIINMELKMKFKIKNPKILVCGLNPHAGENGYIGIEEKKIIEPVIKELSFEGINVHGPLPADTILNEKKYDIILSMYHDQILPALKFINFNSLVNTTLGIPIIRTSVDHGTAIDLAGTNQANSESMENAINMAINFVKNINA